MFNKPAKTHISVRDHLAMNAPITIDHASIAIHGRPLKSETQPHVMQRIIETLVTMQYQYADAMLSQTRGVEANPEVFTS